MRAIILAGALLAVPSAAAEQERFDLICTGQSKLRAFAASSASTVRYRIDLLQGSWCAENCSTVQKLVRIEEGRLVLVEKRPADRLGYSALNEIDRVSGKNVETIRGGSLYLDASRSCIPAPFSGFPSRKF